MPLWYTCTLKRGSQYPTIFERKKKKHQKNEFSRNNIQMKSAGPWTVKPLVVSKQATKKQKEPGCPQVSTPGRAVRKQWPPHSDRISKLESPSGWAVLGTRTQHMLSENACCPRSLPHQQWRHRTILICSHFLKSPPTFFRSQRTVLTSLYHSVSTQHPPLVIFWHFFQPFMGAVPETSSWLKKPHNLVGLARSIFSISRHT